MKCFLCNSENIELKQKGVRDNPNVDVLKCKNCSLEFLSSFEHINDNFYETGQMHNTTYTLQSWINTTQNDDNRRFLLLKDLIKNKKLLDFGTGNAQFLILAKQVTENVFGVEDDKSLTDYFQKNNLTIYQDINKFNEKFDIITLFHVLEHLKTPEKYLTELANHLADNGKIIIEVPNMDDILIEKNKEFRKFTYWGCHLFGYNAKTLKMLVEMCNLKVEKIDFIQRYPLSNHLYWYFKKKPSGHKKWAKIDFLNKFYKNYLIKIGKTDTIMVTISKQV